MSIFRLGAMMTLGVAPFIRVFVVELRSQLLLTYHSMIAACPSTLVLEKLLSY